MATRQRPVPKRLNYVGCVIVAVLLGCTPGCAFNHVYRVGSAFVRVWSGVIVARDLIGVEEEVESELLEHRARQPPAGRNGTK